MLKRSFFFQVQNLYSTYQYHNVAKTIINFVTNDVSATYCHLVKDRLYCEDANYPYRAGAVDVMDAILTIIVKSIAPISPHLAEEVWLHHPENLGMKPFN